MVDGLAKALPEDTLIAFRNALELRSIQGGICVASAEEVMYNSRESLKMTCTPLHLYLRKSCTIDRVGSLKEFLSASHPTSTILLNKHT